MNSKNSKIQEKISYLRKEQERLRTRLEGYYKTFRGVRHENSESEMKYTTIKVLEAHIQSIEEEIKSLQNL